MDHCVERGNLDNEKKYFEFRGSISSNLKLDLQEVCKQGSRRSVLDVLVQSVIPSAM